MEDCCEDKELAEIVTKRLLGKGQVVEATIDPETGEITFHTETSNTNSKVKQMTKSVQEQKKELFTRIFNLECEVLNAQELQKEVKEEYSYDRDMNVNGIPKDEVAKLIKAAKAAAKENDLKEKAKELLELDELVEEYS